MKTVTVPVELFRRMEKEVRDVSERTSLDFKRVRCIQCNAESYYTQQINHAPGCWIKQMMEVKEDE